MLSARKLDVPIDVLGWEKPTPCLVVFNLFKGNIEKHNPWTWDEPPEFDDVEIVSVFDDSKQDVQDLMTNREYAYLQDMIVAVLEDEKCSG